MFLNRRRRRSAAAIAQNRNGPEFAHLVLRGISDLLQRKKRHP